MVLIGYNGYNIIILHDSNYLFKCCALLLLSV